MQMPDFVASWMKDPIPFSPYSPWSMVILNGNFVDGCDGPDSDGDGDGDDDGDGDGVGDGDGDGDGDGVTNLCSHSADISPSKLLHNLHHCLCLPPYST